MKNFQKQKSSATHYWIYGKHSVLAVLHNPKRKIRKVLILPQNKKYIAEKFMHLTEVCDSRNIINETQNTASNTQGFAALTEPLSQPSLQELLPNTNNQLVVLLDQLSDPQNIGAIFRSAAAFKAAAIITSHDNAPKETATLVKSSSGAFEILPFVKVVNISQAVILLKKHGYWIIGLDGKAPAELDQSQLTYDKIALVLGSEENGIRPLVKKGCDVLLKIQMNPCVESLNVSNAAAIALHHIFTKNSHS